MKDYFSHDYNARNDKKLVRLAMKYGMNGIGIFWCIAEMLYEEEGEIKVSECDRIAFELRADKELILNIIQDEELELFKIHDGKFYSESVSHRLFMRNEKSEKARLSAAARWPDSKDANATETQGHRNANKGKESKRKENEIVLPSKSFSKDSTEYKLSFLLFNWIKDNNAAHKFHNLDDEKSEKQIQKFARDADMILRVDKRDAKLAEFLIVWSQSEPRGFWKSNVLSMSKFREQFDTLAAQAKRSFQDSNKFVIPKE